MFISHWNCDFCCLLLKQELIYTTSSKNWLSSSVLSITTTGMSYMVPDPLLVPIHQGILFQWTQIWAQIWPQHPFAYRVPGSYYKSNRDGWWDETFMACFHYSILSSKFIDNFCLKGSFKAGMSLEILIRAPGLRELICLFLMLIKSLVTW